MSAMSLRRFAMLAGALVLACVFASVAEARTPRAPFVAAKAITSAGSPVLSASAVDATALSNGAGVAVDTRGGALGDDASDDGIDAALVDSRAGLALPPAAPLAPPTLRARTSVPPCPERPERPPR